LIRAGNQVAVSLQIPHRRGNLSKTDFHVAICRLCATSEAAILFCSGRARHSVRAELLCGKACRGLPAQALGLGGIFAGRARHSVRAVFGHEDAQRAEDCAPYLFFALLRRERLVTLDAWFCPSAKSCFMRFHNGWPRTVGFS